MTSVWTKCPHCQVIALAELISTDAERSPSMGPFVIRVNSHAVNVYQRAVSYEVARGLANCSRDVLYTVAYFRADDLQDSGTLTPGESVNVKDGTTFDVVFTG